MSAAIVIAAAVAIIAMAARWLVWFTGNSDASEKLAKTRPDADPLSGGMSCVLCRRTGCRHIGSNGRCMRKSILVGHDGSCRDFAGKAVEQ